jgi:hypothetical protein
MKKSKIKIMLNFDKTDLDRYAKNLIGASDLPEGYMDRVISHLTQILFDEFEVRTTNAINVEVKDLKEKLINESSTSKKTNISVDIKESII